MRHDLFHSAVMALPGVVMDIKWGGDRVYTVGGRMFAVAGHEGEAEPLVSFKTSDIGFEMLVEMGVAIPAPYLARAKWVQLRAPDALSDPALIDHVTTAHGLIAARLSKKARTALGIH